MDSKTSKKLIKIVLLTLVISYVVDKLVFFGLNKISDNVMTGQSIGKLNQFLKTKESSDLIVFGNSRANHHFDVKAFSNNAYNIGVDATGIAFSSTLINTLPKHKKQTIIVHIDTKNFFDKDYDGSDIRGLKTKYKRDPFITNALYKSGQISFLQNIYYSMNYNGNAVGILKNYFRPNYDYKLYDGYDPLTLSKAQEEKRDFVLNITDDKNCLNTYSINSVALEYLESIKSYVNNNSDKTFIFITSPIYNDICDGDNKRLNALMQDLDLNYTDFTNLFKDSNNNSYWKDKTHLSKKGAEAFSTHLIEYFDVLKN